MSDPAPSARRGPDMVSPTSVPPLSSQTPDNQAPDNQTADHQPPTGQAGPASPQPDWAAPAGRPTVAAVGSAGGARLAALEDARRKPLSPLGRGTLSRKLVLRTGAIVTLIAVLLGLASTIAVRHQLMNNLDNKLVSASNRPPRDPNSASDDDQPKYGSKGGPIGTDVGQLTVVKTSAGGATYAQGLQYVEGGSKNLDDDVTRSLALACPTKPTTMNLGDGLGQFRVLSHSLDDGDTQIVALPMSTVNHSLRELILTELALTLFALAAAMALSLALVRSSLKPLNRLATTATEVSNLALDRGEVALPTRVPGRDADPNSEVGRVGHAFNHMLNNVEGALAARQQSETKVRQFVADASHELRNPLAAIRGYAELTGRRSDELPADAAYAIGRIESESTRMSRLVEDMLLLARLDNDPTLELAEVDVVELVLNAVSDAQVAGPTHEWAVELPDTPVVARADALKLHQVVANLLSNARKHTPAGTEVTTGVGIEGRHAVITVTDDGPGIDEAVRDHVFERFARADTARAHNKEGSTGLGLAIVAAVMEAHGGSAAVDSRPGRTRFTLHVPLA